MSEICNELHQIFNVLHRHSFPYDKDKIPLSGIYILFEEGEFAHKKQRIVRIGTHTGTHQLRSRLSQHFIVENKDRSIFRKNIGLALLNKESDPFLKMWNYDLTTKEARDNLSKTIDMDKQKEIERLVTKYIQRNCSFTVFQVNDKDQRLELESKLISTISLCSECQPSGKWLGLNSPKHKIRESGLWQENELYKTPLSDPDIASLSKLLSDHYSA